MQFNDRVIAILLATVWCGISAALAADVAPFPQRPIAPPPLVGGGNVTELTVPLYKSQIVTVTGPANRISIGSPDIADIVVISPSQLYVLGKDIGTTNVLLWDSSNHLIGSISIQVQHDLEDLKRKLAEILPGEAIEVRATQRSIVLTGRVSDVEKMNAAVRIAEKYLMQIQTAVKSEEFKQEPKGRINKGDMQAAVGEVINLLQVGGVQQVMLEVKISEMQRTEVRNLNAQFNAFKNGGQWNFGGVNGGATFPPYLNPSNQMVPVFTSANAAGNLTRWGPPVSDFLPNPMSIADQGLFGSFLGKNFMFNLALDAALDQGLAKVLAEPTLTTLTGQEAKFLSGGEFPIPVQGSLGQVTIVYKDFGVALDFIPVVLENGRINLKLSVSVSDLVATSSLGVTTTNSNSVLVIPSLSVRSASGTVELLDGQTIGLAGLLNDSLTQAINKFPGLGELPILGALFRSQSYQKGDTELVILVTPHLAKPLPKNKIKLPTDSFVEPNDLDFYLWGHMEGSAKPAPPGQN
ncbi:MAG: type II and III secretion system protein family protein [Steroidobacterales bacterium]